MKRLITILLLLFTFSFANAQRAGWWYGNAPGEAAAGPDTLTLTYWNDFVLLHIANTGITEDANGVSEWQDRSGNGNHSTQSVNANKPSTDVDGNVVFDGNDFLTSTFYLGDTTTQYDVYMVFEVTEAGSAANVTKPIEYNSNPSTYDSLFFNMQVHAIDVTTYDLRAIFLRNPTDFAILDTLTEGNTHLISMSSVETQQDSFFLDSQFKVEKSSSTYYETLSSGPIYGSAIGSQRAGTTQYLNGKIKFLGVTKRRFTAAERSTTESELNSFFTIY